MIVQESISFAWTFNSQWPSSNDFLTDSLKWLKWLLNMGWPWHNKKRPTLHYFGTIFVDKKEIRWSIRSMCSYILLHFNVWIFNSFQDIEYSTPLECTPRNPITFKLPIRFQQTSEPVAANFSLNTRFFLLNRKQQWLSNKFTGSEADDVAFTKGILKFRKVFDEKFLFRFLCLKTIWWIREIRIIFSAPLNLWVFLLPQKMWKKQK